MIDPARTTVPRGELLAALAGDDIRPCPTCRGTGRVLVGPGRGMSLDCPPCRSTGIQGGPR